MLPTEMSEQSLVESLLRLSFEYERNPVGIGMFNAKSTLNELLENVGGL